MPQYNLAAPEEQVVVTWLFEPVGYLDVVDIASGLLAREALAAAPSLDVTQWVRDNGSQGWEFKGRRHDSVALELALVWWIWKHDQVNVTPPSRPPETSEWVATLQVWDESINTGFAGRPQAVRNQQSVPIYDEAGVADGTMPAGSHLAHQQGVISKVLGVLT